MTFFANLSIKTKLSLIALLTCSTALVLACAALFINEIQSFKTTLVRDLKAQASILGSLSTAALEFSDNKTANEILGELKNQPHIKGAVIFQQQKVFGSYQRAGVTDELPSQPAAVEGHVFEHDAIHLDAPILLKGERIGSIHLCGETSELWARLKEYGRILLAVFLTSAFVSLLLAFWLQRSIVGPVLLLSNAAKDITEHQDYSIRVQQHGQDELGRLTVTFNQMLARIQVQDAAVREGRERYEVAVAGARDGIWDWNIATDAVYFSRQWKEMLGYEENELGNRFQVLIALVHQDDRDTILRAFEDYLSGKRDSYEKEFRMIHKNGSVRWVLARGAALRDAQGKPYRMAGSHTDITERRNAAEELKTLNDRLVETSRRAGMAEVATGVLHNVGNVLNSVNVSTTLIREKLQQSRLSHLVKAISMMHDHAANLAAFLTADPKGRQLPPFLEKLSGHLMEENKVLLEETDSLDKNVQHIKQIVAAQQSHARVFGTIESLVPKDLMEDALRINAESLVRHGIRIVRDYSPTPPVLVDRHKVMQILINLTRNAKQALVTSADADKQITLAIASGENGCVRLSVTDNGGGIKPENLSKVFQHGFTTKKDGHGFGLHSCALAAQEMKGHLKVHSTGPGCGATFTLELPMDQKAIAA